MKGIKKVIYWHRFGQKVYELPLNSSPILEKEITSSDIVDIEEGLSYLNGQSVLLLLSDSISYLYEKIIDPPIEMDESFKGKLLEIIKADIPEDFSEFTWDYKVENDFDGKQKVIIFAPIKEFQNVISEISTKLMIKIEAMETESVAATRDPNPILGILKKPDIKGKDEETLNMSAIPDDGSNKSPFKIIGIIILIILLLVGSVFLIKNLKNSNVGSLQKKVESTKIIEPSSAPSIVPTVAEVLKWEDLKVVVQNGTNQTGLASKMALSVINSGISQVDTSNADSKDYVSNVLIFKDTLLKERYQEKFKELISVGDDDIKVDNSIVYDVVFILGLN